MDYPKFTLPVIAILSFIGMVFSALKLFGVLTWPWWLVTAPIWLPLVIFVAAVFALIAVWMASGSH